MSVYTISAGHCPDGGIGSGAVGYLKESTEARKITKYVVEYLKKAGHIAYDCTCEVNVSQTECLVRIVNKHNQHDAALAISVHLNCNKKSAADGRTTGAEVLMLSKSGDQNKVAVANRILAGLEELGFTNRGIKIRSDLYVLKHTADPCILIEVFFCDDEDDCKLYKDKGVKAISKVIAEAIVGHSIQEHKVYAGCTVVTMKKLKIRNSYSKDFIQLGTLNAGTVLPVIKVKNNRAMFADGLWIKCTESCVKVNS